jgi:uncharacterized protein (UPF0297 family)
LAVFFGQFAIFCKFFAAPLVFSRKVLYNKDNCTQLIAACMNFPAPTVKGDRFSMSDTNKFLYLDTAEAAVAEREDTPCPCCEDSLTELISIIRACGQDPATQLSGYLITEDPTYLPEGTNARAIARRVGRDKLLTTLIDLYVRYCPATREET